MAFDNLDDTEILEEPEVSPPEESSNRMFIIIAGVLGAIALFALICIAVYVMVLLPQRKAVQDQQKATLDAQNTGVAAIIASTSTAAAEAAIEAAYTSTATHTSVVASPSTSGTPVVAVSTGSPAAPTLAPEMATATALYPTLTANAILFAQTLTARPPLATQIPDTGFADEVGLPMMLGLAALLIFIVFLARRLRTA